MHFNFSRWKILKVIRFYDLKCVCIFLYSERTTAPTDMQVVPKEPAWAQEHAGAIRNPEFRIRAELEPENRFSRFALLWPNQDTYIHLQGTCGSGLT